MAEWNKLNTIDFINLVLGDDHLTLGGGEVISGHQEFFF